MMEAILVDYQYPDKSSLTAAADLVLFPVRTLFEYKTILYDPSAPFKKEDEKCRNIFLKIIMAAVSLVLLPLILIAALIKYLDPQTKKVHESYQQKLNSKGMPAQASVQAPIQIENAKKPDVEGKIEFKVRGTGELGSDQKFNFATRMRLISGENLKTSPKDFYCEMSAFPETLKEYAIGSTLYLPSSLFTQGRVGNQLKFYWDDKLCFLDLEKDTEAQLKFVEEHIRYKAEVFVFEEDVPGDYTYWCKINFSRHLSPEAKKIPIGALGTVPLDFEELPEVDPDPDELRGFFYQHTKSLSLLLVFQLSGCNKDDIHIILDQKILYVYAKPYFPKIDRNQFNLAYINAPSELFTYMNIAEQVDPQSLDLAKTSAKLGDDGYLTLELFIQENVSI